MAASGQFPFGRETAQLQDNPADIIWHRLQESYHDTTERLRKTFNETLCKSVADGTEITITKGITVAYNRDP